ncbi:MAG: UDP-N-acetylmuramate dehydrogenase [Candidatus Moranbacteria bacterium]|nr:UDP-N-acetylmuramate dehydrogenase [Candidatus Moranbacteria bacterium]
MTIKENIPLAPLTTFKIGGPARYFSEAGSGEEIIEALEFAREKSLPVFVMGGGSNILVSDKGFEGLVIKIQSTSYKIHDTNIECGAGCQLSTIVRESIKSGLTGLEWAAGIPGTIGGAVRGNAGAYGGTMADSVESVRVVEIPIAKSQASNKFSIFNFQFSKKSEFQISNFKNKDCKFSYRDSIFKRNPNLIILSVKLGLQKGSREESEKRIKEIISKRREKQPADFPSAGSFFKNPSVKKADLLRIFESDTGMEARGGKIPAGYLIDGAGMRGKKIGGAMVSEKHANFIVNTGGATAENVMMLAAIIKTRVRNRFDIQLQEEVQMVGF